MFLYDTSTLTYKYLLVVVTITRLVRVSEMMEQNKPNTAPSRYVTPEMIIELMQDYDEPVWTRDKLAEALGVSRPTIGKRIDDLRDDRRVAEDKIGNAEVFYIDEKDERPIEEQHASSIKRHFEDKFIGLQTEPWTAIHPNDGPAEAGDKIQIEIEGVPGSWRQIMTHHWDSRREEYIHDIHTSETQAQISGELYAKPTTPIEHTEYPDDYDLEGETGAQIVEKDGRNILVVGGFKSYLLRPCNDAVFLRDVRVDWISPVGEGDGVPTYDPEQVIEDVGSFEEVPEDVE